MSQLALDLGFRVRLVTEAVYARCLSAMKDARVRASKVLAGPRGGKYAGSRDEFVEHVRQALYASKICSYAQGFVQLRAAAQNITGRSTTAIAHCCGEAVASSAPCFWNVSRKPSMLTRIVKSALGSLLPASDRKSSACLAERGQDGHRPGRQCRPSLRRSPTTTAIDPNDFPPICFRRNATTLALIHTSARTKRACITPNG